MNATAPTFLIGIGIGDEELFFWVVMNSIGLFFATVKLMFFLRVSDKFVLLVELLFSVFVDITPFLLFFSIFIIVISLLYRISGVEVSASDYPDLNTYFLYAVQIFRNSIGDVATPDITFWTGKIAEGPRIAYFNIYYGWFLWIINVLANMIILLNFLIAIISQSYENVITRSSSVIYKGKCDVIYEITLLTNYLERTFGEEYQAQVFSLHSNVESEEVGANEGIVRPIKARIVKMNG